MIFSMLIQLFSFVAVALLSLSFVPLLMAGDGQTDIFSLHNGAEILSVVLSLILASTAIAYRSLIERLQGITAKYAEFTDPDSEKGSQLSPREKEHLYTLVLSEVKATWSEYGGAFIDYIGRFLKGTLRVVGLR